MLKQEIRLLKTPTKIYVHKQQMFLNVTYKQQAVNVVNVSVLPATEMFGIFMHRHLKAKKETDFTRYVRMSWKYDFSVVENGL